MADAHINVPKLNCKHCKEKGDIISDRHSDPRKCGFDTTGTFTDNNYCCATLLEIRSIAEDKDLVICNCDENFVLFHLGHHELESFEDGDITVVIHWYKSRGRTTAGWILRDNTLPPTPLRADVAVELLAELKRRYYNQSVT